MCSRQDAGALKGIISKNECSVKFVFSPPRPLSNGLFVFLPHPTIFELRRLSPGSVPDGHPVHIVGRIHSTDSWPTICCCYYCRPGTGWLVARNTANNYAWYTLTMAGYPCYGHLPWWTVELPRHPYKAHAQSPYILIYGR